MFVRFDREWVGGGLCYLGEMKNKKKGFIIIAKFELKGRAKKGKDV